MSSSTNMNIVLGQGSAIKEVHNIRKQHLELNQGFVQQKTEESISQKRVAVQEFDKSNRITDEKKKKKEHRRQAEEKADASSEQSEFEEADPPKGGLIDIRV